MSLRIAVFGQAAFGRDVLEGLLDAGHEIVGVYAPPAGSRPDPLAEEAEKRGLLNLRSTVACVPLGTSDESIELFGKYKV